MSIWVGLITAGQRQPRRDTESVGGQDRQLHSGALPVCLVRIYYFPRTMSTVQCIVLYKLCKAAKAACHFLATVAELRTAE